MFANSWDVNRKYIGKNIQNYMELPNLVDIQTASYEKFLQRNKLAAGEELENIGLQSVFTSIFPIVSANEDMALEFEFYTLDMDRIKYSEYDCKKKGRTYAVPLRARINLTFYETGEIRQKDIYLGDIPLMTDRGTFIINGAERVVVSQLHRSPGVIFTEEKDGVFSSRLIPYRGNWLEFEIDRRHNVVMAKVDRKKGILATLFLRALGIDTREKIIRCFHGVQEVSVADDRDTKENLVGRVLASSVMVDDEGEQRKLFRAGEKLNPHTIDDIIAHGVSKIDVIDFECKNSLNSTMIINCFEREDIRFPPDDEHDEPTPQEAVTMLYSILQAGNNMMTTESALQDLKTTFFSERRYELGAVGRYKLNKKFNYENGEGEFNVPGTDIVYNRNPRENVLTIQDIISTIRFLINVNDGREPISDIDHLGNRRVRSVGELLTTQMKAAVSKIDRIAKERMTSKDRETLKPQDLVSIKPLASTLKEFFGSSQLSQFMDQVNPLSEMTHKRRLNALGPGGLSRDRAGFAVRDVHYTHYGRICPIETPEGPNIGLILSLAIYAKVNEYGFLESPFRKIEDGKATETVEYLTADDEEHYYIAQASVNMDKDGRFTTDTLSCRRSGDYTTRSPKEIQYMDVSPKQVISVSSAMIPFLEHDDANRALMGSNMQRQAVPLLFPEPPRVGTGMEAKCGYDSGVLVKSRTAGVVSYVTSDEIHIQPTNGGENEVYRLLKYTRTNKDTCYHQRPIVSLGQNVEAGQVIADGPAMFKGELALGRNILVGFVPWNGYNYEDAILISQRVIKEDMFTSIHIKTYSCEVRETKLGPERISRDIPNKSEEQLKGLDGEGIIRVGEKVRSGDILVGKVSPKNDTETTPEFKLLMSIFGETLRDVKDSSLTVPHGVEGTVIEVQRLKRSEGDELNPGVEEMITVLVASKRKLREGDKMAGRHGNKGIVARILPEEDMPYMEDGTPLDICLNPLGVPSRMNIGQIMESELGLAGKYLNEWYESPVFQSPSNEQIEEKLQEAGFNADSKVVLRDGKTGEPFENPVFVGVIYFMKLDHLVDDKMHARSIGPYSMVTQQPLGGKAQFGGQRLGEMEVWALEAYGAASNLQELLTIKSDDMQGRTRIYEAIVKGEADNVAGVPEAFNVLAQELRGLALDFSIYDSKGKQIPLTERDEELIAKTNSDF